MTVNSAKPEYAWTLGYRTGTQTKEMDTFNRPRIEFQRFYLTDPVRHQFTTDEHQAYTFSDYLSAKRYARQANLRVDPVKIRVCGRLQCDRHQEVTQCPTKL